MTDTIDTSARVRNFIISQFPLARRHSLENATLLLDTGMIDSLGVLDLVRFIEQDFGIQVADDDLTPEHFSTIDSISNMILQKRNGLR